MIGKFIGIGVGPGDPELITIKAAKALKVADIVCVPKSHTEKPSMALGMIQPILDQRRKPVEVLELVFPMTKDKLSTKTLWVNNARIVASKVKEGKVLAFITLGDPMLYSTFVYLYQTLKERYPKVNLEIIPGVTSVTAAAASAKLPLALKDESVSIMPSDLDPSLMEETARYADNIVFMKNAYRIKELLPILARAGFPDDASVALVKRCTYPEEKVLTGKLSDVKNWEIVEDYFSVAIVKRGRPVPINWKKGDEHE